MFVLRCYFFCLSKIIKIKTCSVGRVETAEGECGGAALHGKTPTVVLGLCNTAWPVGERMSLGFFDPPLAVRTEGEVGTQRISFFLSPPPLSCPRIHYIPIQVLMRRRTGNAAEKALLACEASADC